MAEATFSFDLHVLSTPPAFNLSQNQTLQFKSVSNPCGKPQKSESQSSLPIRYSLVNEPEAAAVSSGVGLYALFLIDCQELFFVSRFFFAEEFRSFPVAGKLLIGFSIFICQAIF